MTPSYSLILSAPTDFLITYGLLMAALLSVWLMPGRIWHLLFLSSAGYGFMAGILSLTALEASLGFWVATHLAFRSDSPLLKMMAFIITIVMAAALLLDFVPGFKPWVIGEHLQLSEKATPFTHSISYAYGLLTLCILGSGAVPLFKYRAQWSFMVSQHTRIMIAAGVALGVITYLSEYVDWDFTWTQYVYFWAFTNFLFICGAEEAVLRGLVHASLQRHLGRWKTNDFAFGEWLALLFTSSLCVLRHIYHGETIMLFTGVASLFCGYAFMRYRSIEGTMTVHLAINTVQFLAFTYPVVL